MSLPLYSLAAGVRVVVSVVVPAEDNELIHLFMVSTVACKDEVSLGFVCLSLEEDMVRFTEKNVLEFATVRRKSVAKQLVLFDCLIHT